MRTRNEELVQLVIEILTRTGVTRAWRLGFERGAELVVVLEPWEFERIDADRLTEQLVEATRWKVWVTYKREPPGDLVRLI